MQHSPEVESRWSFEVMKDFLKTDILIDENAVNFKELAIGLVTTAIKYCTKQIFAVISQKYYADTHTTETFEYTWGIPGTSNGFSASLASTPGVHIPPCSLGIKSTTKS